MFSLFRVHVREIFIKYYEMPIILMSLFNYLFSGVIKSIILAANEIYQQLESIKLRKPLQCLYRNHH